MERLRSEFGVYGVDSGRICVAALNSKNIDAVVQRDRQGALKQLELPAGRANLRACRQGDSGMRRMS